MNIYIYSLTTNIAGVTDNADSSGCECACHPCSMLQSVVLIHKILSSENISPGSLQILWHTQDVIHIIFHLKKPSLGHSNWRVIILDLLGTQHLLSIHTPQKVNLQLCVVEHPEKSSFSALGNWNVGWHVFPFGICKTTTKKKAYVFTHGKQTMKKNL